jgi:DNA helicase-2/ATP-dependent DNA helicase PcrA
MNNLSEEQSKIINAKEDIILAVASPGSGKTHTIIGKYIELINNADCKTYFDSNNIILITFTKKSGLEMLERIKKLSTKLPYYVGTIHGLCYKVLKEHKYINHNILDVNDMKNLIDNITFNKNVKEDFISIINDVSNTYPINFTNVLTINNKLHLIKEYKDFYKKYQEKKKKEKLIDFNDLMIMFCKFLESDKSYKFKQTIKYLFFDEYQDINMIQNYILTKMVENNDCKLMLVGDDAQSIYSFRGSSIEYILNFNNIFKTDKTKGIYILSENYRSTSGIVNFCQDIINCNMVKYDKKVVSKITNINTIPLIVKFSSVTEQYKWIANDIIKKHKMGVSYKDIAIIARKNHLLNNIEYELLSCKIPVIKNQNTLLLEKQHIKDFFAYIIVINNMKSTFFWKKILLMHSIKNQDINFILNENSEEKSKNDSIMMRILELSNKYEKLKELHSMMINIKKIKKEIDKIHFIINYQKNFYSDTNIIDEIKSIVKPNIKDFINEIYLNQDFLIDDTDSVMLTTSHSAKGLEWEHVYIIDMNSNDFPSVRINNFDIMIDNVEEERRLFYVSASRAKTNLTITYHQTNNDKIIASPFIRDINKSLYILQGEFTNIKLTNNIINDVNNYLKFYGYNKFKFLLYNNNCKADYNTIRVNKKIIIPYNISCLQFEKVLNKFLTLVIYNILQKKENAIDCFTNCYNIMKNNLKNNFIEDENSYNKFINTELISYYNDIKKGIIKLLENKNIISIDYKLNYKNLQNSNIDILCDDTIIIIDYNPLSINRIIILLLYSKIISNIKNILFYNPLIGTAIQFNINFDINNIYNIIYI